MSTCYLTLEQNTLRMLLNTQHQCGRGSLPHPSYRYSILVYCKVRIICVRIFQLQLYSHMTWNPNILSLSWRLEDKLDLVNLEMPYALVNYNRIIIQTKIFYLNVNCIPLFDLITLTCINPISYLAYPLKYAVCVFEIISVPVFLLFAMPSSLEYTWNLKILFLDKWIFHTHKTTGGCRRGSSSRF